MARAAAAAAGVLAAAIAAAAAADSPRADPGCARYASATGSDGAIGSAAHPFRTAQRLVSSLSHGAVGCLLPGTFRGRVVIDHPLVLRGIGSPRATIVGGVTLTPAARGAAVQHLVIRGQGAGRAAVLVNADRARVAGNSISGTGYADRNTACVLLAGPRNAVIDGNRIESCTRATRRGLAAPGIFVGSALGTQLTNNLVVHTAGVGILLGPNAQRTRVVHNLVDGNAGGVLISGNDRTASSHNIVLANIFSNSGGANVAASWRGVVGRGNVVASNCLWHGFGGNVHAPGVRVTGNVVTSPRYANRPRDYTVRAAACIPKRPVIVAGQLPALRAFRVSFHVRALPHRVQIVSLALTGLTAGSRLTARCIRSCTASWAASARGTSIALPMLNGRWLPVGAQLEVRATKPGSVGVWARIAVTGLPNGVAVTHGVGR